MKETYKKTLLLIIRSKKESLFYLLAFLAGAPLYAYLFRLFYFSQSAKAVNYMPAAELIAFLPGVLLAGWFGAGLNGIFTERAVLLPKLGSFAHYANRWFIYKLTADILVAAIKILPVVILMVMSLRPSGLISAIWLPVMIFILARFALWLNASVAENLNFIDALKRSFVITRGHACKLFSAVIIPLIIAVAVKLLLKKTLSDRKTAFILMQLINGVLQILLSAIFAVFYAKLKKEGNTEAKTETDGCDPQTV